MQVEIRPLRETDAQTSVEWRNDPAIWEQTKSRPDHTISLQDEIEWVRRINADSTSHRFAIEADGVYVGNIYLTDVEAGVGEYHVFIGDKSYWGRGVAKQASIQLIDYARTALKLSHIKLEVRASNENAVRLYQRLGFLTVDEGDGFLHMMLTL